MRGTKEICYLKNTYNPVPLLIPANFPAANLTDWIIKKDDGYWSFIVGDETNIKTGIIYEFYIR